MVMRMVDGRLGCVAFALVAATFGGAASPAAAQVPLDVMTFNIRTANGRDGDDAWPNRKDLVAETIERFGPHVVGLQEAVGEQVEYLESALPETTGGSASTGGSTAARGSASTHQSSTGTPNCSRSSPGTSGSRRRLIHRPTSREAVDGDGGLAASSPGPGFIMWRLAGGCTCSTPISPFDRVNGSSSRPH